MRGSRIVLLVVGVLVALVGFPVAAGGGALVWAHATQRDDDGYYSTSMERFETSSRALTSTEIDLATGAGEDWADFADRWGTVKITLERERGEPVFVGIARRADVERYLDGVSHDEIVEVGAD